MIARSSAGSMPEWLPSDDRSKCFRSLPSNRPVVAPRGSRIPVVSILPHRERQADRILSDPYPPFQWGLVRRATVQPLLGHGATTGYALLQNEIASVWQARRQERPTCL